MELPFDRLMGITPAGWITLILVNIPVYLLLAWVWFRDRDEFGDAIEFWLTPNWISYLWDEYEDDWWANALPRQWRQGLAITFGKSKKSLG